MDLSTPLTYVKGVGPARAAMLEAKGLATVEDLLGYVPFRYEDRSNMKTVAQLAPGEMATVIVDVLSAKGSGFKRRDLGLFEARFSDSSRAILVGKWFHGGYLAKVLAEGMKLAVYGKVEFDSYSVRISSSLCCTPNSRSSPAATRTAKPRSTPAASCPSTRPPAR